MTYKSINTFIDDLFAFVIQMPILHRLACLRDDVIFFIFCWQRYKYRTDFTRVNEFGQCSQPTEEMLDQITKEREEENLNEGKVMGGTADQGTVSVAKNLTERVRRSARDKKRV